MKNVLKMSHDFDVHKHIRLIGLAAILIFIITQSMEFSGIAMVCVFCRTIRACIGLIGLIMVLPICPVLSKLFTIVIAFIGAHVASAAIFINIEQATFMSEFFVLSLVALFIFAAQVMIITSYKTVQSGAND